LSGLNAAREWSGGPGALRCRPARSLWERFRGLMLAPPLAPGEALWFPRCGAVHTAFVRVPLDLLFLSGRQIVRVDTAVPPWRIAACRGADSVVELAAGEARRLGLVPGQSVDLPGSPESQGGVP
jgi:uncharacterized protein